MNVSHIVVDNVDRPICVPVIRTTLDELARPDCPCGQPARLVALPHAIDACDTTLAETPSGAEIYLLCLPCARLLHESVVRQIKRRLSRLPKGSVPTCGGCGRPVMALHDVLEYELL